jgi:hypothetical protein
LRLDWFILKLSKVRKSASKNLPYENKNGNSKKAFISKIEKKGKKKKFDIKEINSPIDFLKNL